MKTFIGSLALLSLLATVSTYETLGGSALKLNNIFESTSWDLLEDLYLYHNAIRYFHHSEQMHFNRTLMDYARLKALILAWYDGNVPADNGDLKFGENIHWSPINDVPVNASDVIDDWYFGEEQKYNYEAPALSTETQHFTQMVWNSTERFGCGQAVSKGTRGGTYTVCYYDPPGNVQGEEARNVFVPSWDDYEESGDNEVTQEQPSTGSADGQGQTEGETTPSPDEAVGATAESIPQTLIRSFVANSQSRNGKGFFSAVF